MASARDAQLGALLRGCRAAGRDPVAQSSAGAARCRSRRGQSAAPVSGPGDALLQNAVGWEMGGTIGWWHLELPWLCVFTVTSSMGLTGLGGTGSSMGSCLHQPETSELRLHEIFMK